MGAESVNKRLLVSFGAVVLLAVVQTVGAQQQKKILRIGYLSLGVLATVPYRTDAFRQGMRQLGYAEGKDLVIEDRFADGN